MRKMVMNIRGAVGSVPKTRDGEFEAKSKAMQQMEQSIRTYIFSIDRMKSAAKTLSQAFDNVAKAFETLVEDAEPPESMKEIVNLCKDNARKIRCEDLGEYTLALDGDIAAEMKTLKSRIVDLRKVESTREHARAEYDAYRDAVASKEKTYEKKRKDISDSKTYDDDVAARDAAQAVYDKANRKYKKEADAIKAEQFKTFLGAMQAFSAHTEKFFSAIRKHFSKLDALARKASV